MIEPVLFRSIIVSSFCLLSIGISLRVSVVVHAAAICIYAFGAGALCAICEHGFSPAQVAARMGYERVFQRSLKRGTDVNLTDQRGRSLLYIAAQAGHVGVCHLLIQNGAAVDQTANDGRSPLHAAASRGHADICQLLCKHGANANRTATDGCSPLHAVVCSDEEEEFADICWLLVERGADPYQPNQEGHSPLFIAARLGRGTLFNAMTDMLRQREALLARRKAAMNHSMRYFLMR